MVKRVLAAAVILGVSMTVPGRVGPVLADDSGEQNSAAAGVHAAAVPDPTIHYTFDTDLLDTYSNSTLTVASACPADPCNSAASFGSDADGKYWTWTSTAARGGGFTLDTTADIGSTYTIAMKFAFNTVTSWRKIIDYKNRVSDNGFYYYGSKLQFYPYTGQTSVTTYPAGTVLDLVAVRKSTGASTGTFTVYAVGSDNSLTQIFQANDTNNASVPHTYGSPTKTKLGFFFDDTATGSEATPTGRVYDLRIWSNTELSASDLEGEVVKPAAVTNVTATPVNSGVTVSWTAVTGATSYIATVGGQSCTVTAPTTTCTVTGLTNGQSVTASVQAIGRGGYSAPATALSVTVGATTTTVAATTTVAPTTTVAQTTTTVAAGDDDPNAELDETGLPKSGSTSTWLALLGFALLLGGLQLVRKSRPVR